VDILDKEWARFGFGAHSGLAWAAQEKEGEADHVSNCTVRDSECRTSDTEVAQHNGERNGLYPGRGWVGFGIACELPL
jgi:hypothetical protein